MTYLKMINLILIYKLLQIDLNKKIFKMNKTFKIIIFNSQIKKSLMNNN